MARSLRKGLFLLHGAFYSVICVFCNVGPYGLQIGPFTHKLYGIVELFVLGIWPWRTN